jgi:peptide/nickel transport system permease protein
VAIIASLAFLGAGVAPPTPELGAMMREGVEVLTVAWWIAVFPGLAVLVLGLGFVLVADSYDERGRR